MLSKAKKKFVLAVAIVMTFAAVGEVYGFPWSDDMFRQPAIQPFQKPKGYDNHLPMPPNSISTDASIKPMTRQDYEGITKNPVPATAESLGQGEFLFATYCVPCHGQTGLGDGPVIKKGFYPVNLTLPPVQARTDGFIYAYIKFGGIVMMPSYNEFVTKTEAWQIVNYVRKLQGALENSE